MSNWISVKDSLNELLKIKHKEILIFTIRKQILVSKIYSDSHKPLNTIEDFHEIIKDKKMQFLVFCGLDRPIYWEDFNDVTHWQPLPEPLEE